MEEVNSVFQHCHLRLEYSLCVGFFASDKTAIFSRLEWGASCRKWTLFFNLALVIHCYSWLFSQNFVIVQAACFVFNGSPRPRPVVEDMPEPTNVPKGRISISTEAQPDWNPDPQAEAFKECKCVQSYRATSISPSGHQWQVFWRCPLDSRHTTWGTRQEYKLISGRYPWAE